jgi:hypothetical protein
VGPVERRPTAVMGKGEKGDSSLDSTKIPHKATVGPELGATGSLSASVRNAVALHGHRQAARATQKQVDIRVPRPARSVLYLAPGSENRSLGNSTGRLYNRSSADVCT